MRKCLIISLILLICLFCTGCGGGPLEASEVVGDYGEFEIDDNNCVWPASDGGKYISIKWKVTDAENGMISFTYEITDDNVMAYDEDFWTEYHEAGFEYPEDALEEYMYEIAESYELPEEGEYKYDRSEKKLVSENYVDYYKKD